jgi:hypothetical protein
MDETFSTLNGERHVRQRRLVISFDNQSIPCEHSPSGELGRKLRSGLSNANRVLALRMTDAFLLSSFGCAHALDFGHAERRPTSCALFRSS